MSIRPGMLFVFLLRGGFMNKSDLYILLSKEFDFSQTNSIAIVDTFFNAIARALIIGDRVEIRGLCSWQPKEYEGYSGRNPHTGEKIEVPSKRLATFKPGKDLLELLNMDRCEEKSAKRKRGRRG